jgi:hypothetical protein
VKNKFMQIIIATIGCYCVNSKLWLQLFWETYNLLILHLISCIYVLFDIKDSFLPCKASALFQQVKVLQGYFSQLLFWDVSPTKPKPGPAHHYLEIAF